MNDTEEAEIYLYEAELALNNSEIVSSEHYILALQAEIKRTFADLYYKKGNHKKEAEYYRGYKTLSDSLGKDQNYKEMTKVRFEYNYKKEKKELELKNQKETYRFYLIILILIFGILLSILLFIQQKSKAKKEQIEKEKSFLKNENLKQKIELSDKQITSNTLIQLNKNEILNSVIEKLQNVKSKFAVSNHEIIDETISDLKKSLAKNNWDNFLDQFEKVHESFFINLNKISDQLTFNEKRLCALIRLKMSIKEIATMNNSSSRSVEMARYRLRKKLNLTGSDESLDDFLEKL